MPTQLTPARRRAIAKRMKLPTAKLPPAQQRMRRIARAQQKRPAAGRARAGGANRNPLFDPSKTLSGRSLARAADALVNMEFRPQEQALDRQAKSATTQGTALVGRSDGYYRQIAAAEADDVAKVQAINAMTQDALKRTGDDTAKRIADAQRGEEERRTADTALRGQNLQADEGTARELAALAARAAETSGVSRDHAAGAGGTFAGLAATAGQARRMRGDETSQQLLNRLANEQAKIRAERESLGAQRGDARQKQILGLRQSQFENLITRRGLGIKKDELEQDAREAELDFALDTDKLAEVKRNNRAGRRLRKQQLGVTRRGQDITARGQDVSAAERRADRAERRRHNLAVENKRSKKNEPASSVRYKEKIDAGRSRFQALAARGYDEARIRKVMTGKDGVPIAAYKAIYDLERKGSLHPANVRALEALGVVVPKSWRRSARTIGTGLAPGTRRGQSRPG